MARNNHRSEINKIETGSLRKISKIDKPLAMLTKRKIGKNKLNKIETKEKHNKEIQRIMQIDF